MFLTIPSIEELKALDIPSLIEMLIRQTNEYRKRLNLEGRTARVLSIKKLLENIQATIESKKAIHKLSP
jgi:hypothetical protein